MVNEVVSACMFTALCWWLGTGVILWLDRLPARSFRFSMAGWPKACKTSACSMPTWPLAA